MGLVADALILSDREFNDFVGGYMEFWNLSPIDDRDEGQEQNPRDLVDIPYGNNQMRAYFASAPNDIDDSDCFVLFGVDTNIYQVADLCKSDGTHLDLKKMDTCEKAASSPKIYVVIKRSYETVKDVKENVRPYMPSNFDMDAHCGILKLA